MSAIPNNVGLQVANANILTVLISLGQKFGAAGFSGNLAISDVLLSHLQLFKIFIEPLT